MYNTAANRTLYDELAEHGIFPYGSPQVLKFEAQMEKYFSREFLRWEGNRELPEEYGVSSFEGGIAALPTKKKSIDVSYNQDERVYRAFLDDDYIAYTCAFFNATETLPPENISLVQAHKNKFDLLIERAQIEDGHTILDLGCGFGGLSKYLMERFDNVRVIGVNPSPVQTRYIREELMADDNPFDNSRFTLIQKYFEDVSDEELPPHSLDRVIILGMFEHVTNMDEVFRRVARVLKPGGKCITHYIVSIDTIPRLLDAGDSMIGDYFPGGHIWPYDEGTRHNTHLAFRQRWFLNGHNYLSTLEHWHRQFWDAIEDLYPEVLNIEQVEYWNRYFSMCKGMFAPMHGTRYGVGHYLYELPA